MTDPRFLLDADICIYLLDGEPASLRAKVERFAPGEVVVSAITYAEVMIGARRHDMVDRAARFFDMIPPLPFDAAAADVYATLSFRRANFDRLVAAHALALDLTLVTNNEPDFADIPGLRVENWTR